MLHDHVVIFSVSTARLPRVPANRRVKVEPLGLGLYRVLAQTGFMESPDVPHILKSAQGSLPFDVDAAVYFMGQDTLVVAGARGMHPWRKRLFVLLAQNSQYAASTFGIPPSKLVKLGGMVEI